MPIDSGQLAKILAKAAEMKRSGISKKVIDTYVQKEIIRIQDSLKAQNNIALKREEEIKRQEIEKKRIAEEKRKKNEVEKRKIEEAKKSTPTIPISTPASKINNNNNNNSNDSVSTVKPKIEEKSNVTSSANTFNTPSYNDPIQRVLPKKVKEKDISEADRIQNKINKYTSLNPFEDKYKPEEKENKKGLSTLVRDKNIVAMGGKPMTNILTAQEVSSPASIVDSIAKGFEKQKIDVELKKQQEQKKLEKAYPKALVPNTSPEEQASFLSDQARIDFLKSQRAWDKNMKESDDFLYSASKTLDEKFSSVPLIPAVVLGATTIFSKAAAAIVSAFSPTTTKEQEEEIKTLEAKLDKQKLPKIQEQLDYYKAKKAEREKSGRGGYIIKEAEEDIITRLEEEKDYLEKGNNWKSTIGYFFDDGLQYMDMPLDIYGSVLKEKIAKNGYNSLSEEDKEIFNMLKDREEIVNMPTSNTAYNIMKTSRGSAEFVLDMAISNFLARGISGKVAKSVLKSEIETALAKAAEKEVAGQLSRKAKREIVKDVIENNVGKELALEGTKGFIAKTALQPSTVQNANKSNFADVQRITDENGQTTALASDEQKLAYAQDLDKKLGAIRAMKNNYERNINNLTEEQYKEYQSLSDMEARVATNLQYLVNEHGELQQESSSLLRHYFDSFYQNAVERYSEEKIGPLLEEKLFPKIGSAFTKVSEKTGVVIPKIETISKIGDKYKTFKNKSSEIFLNNRAAKNITTLGKRYTPVINTLPGEIGEEIFSQIVPDSDKNSDYGDKLKELTELDFYISVAASTGLMSGATATAGAAYHAAKYATDEKYREQYKRGEAIKDIVRNIAKSTDNKDFFSTISNATLGNMVGSADIYKDIAAIENNTGKYATMDASQKSALKTSLERNLVENLIMESFANGAQDNLKETFLKMSTSKGVSSSLQKEALKAISTVDRYQDIVNRHKDKYNANNLINLEIRKDARNRDIEHREELRTSFLNENQKSILESLENLNTIRKQEGLSEITVDDIINPKNIETEDEVNKLFSQLIFVENIKRNGFNPKLSEEERNAQFKKTIESSPVLNLMVQQIQIRDLKDLVGKFDRQIEFQENPDNKEIISAEDIKVKAARVLSQIETLTDIDEDAEAQILELAENLGLKNHPSYMAQIEKKILNKKQQTENENTTDIEERVSDTDTNSTDENRISEEEIKNFNIEPTTENTQETEEEGDNVAVESTVETVTTDIATEATESLNTEAEEEKDALKVETENKAVPEIEDRQEEDTVPDRIEILTSIAERDIDNVAVNYKNRNYIVSKNGIIFSKTTNRVVNFSNKADTQAVLDLANKEFEKLSKEATSETVSADELFSPKNEKPKPPCSGGANI